MNDANARLYVGNLPYSMRTPDLRRIFEAFGTVVDAVVMMEPGARDRSRGFGFVTMATAIEAERAAMEMNDKEIESRKIMCNVAKPRDNQ